MKLFSFILSSLVTTSAFAIDGGTTPNSPANMRGYRAPYVSTKGTQKSEEQQQFCKQLMKAIVSTNYATTSAFDALSRQSEYAIAEFVTGMEVVQKMLIEADQKNNCNLLP